MLAHVGRALRDQNVSPLDRGLRSIVAQQIRNLLAGGWPADEIEKAAVELALTYDRFRGHQALLGLQRVMELADEDRAIAAHAAHRDREGEPPDPRVAATLGPAATRRDPRRLPSNHRFDDDGTRTSTCRICEGPPGVHVTLANIPELEREAMEQMARERDRRRPIRAVGE